MHTRTRIVALACTAAAAAGIGVATISGPAGAATMPSVQICNTMITDSTAVIDFHGTRYGPRTLTAVPYSCTGSRSLPAGLPFTLTVSQPGRPSKVTEWTMPNYIAKMSVYGEQANPQYELGLAGI